MIRFLPILFALTLAAGCTQQSAGVPSAAHWVTAPPQPIPSAHLPVDDRLRNWSGRTNRGGSCTHASTRNAFRAMNANEWDAKWDQLRSQGYEGGETANSLLHKYRMAGLPYIATKSADMRLWDLATASKRVGVWWYYPSHCVTNFGTHDVPGRDGQPRPSVVMLDNNRPESYIAVDRDIAQDAWTYYGGFGAIPWVTPSAPFTFNRLVPYQ